MTLPTLIRTLALIAVIGLPAAATDARLSQAGETATLESTADETFATLSERFRIIYESLRNAGGIDDRSRPLVEGLRKTYAEATERWPDDARGWAGVLQLSMWLEDSSSVESAFERLVAVRPEDDALRMSLASYYKALNRFDRALAVLDELDLDPAENPQAVMLRSELLFAEGRFAESVETLDLLSEDVLESDPVIKSQITALRPAREEYIELWSQEQALREAEATADDLPQVQIVLADGSIRLELFENEAPNTVANFISLAESDFYDGSKFHRVIPSFMAQGGDPNTKPGGTGTPGQGNPGYQIRDEHTQDGRRNHFTGSLAMAKTTAPDTAGCQFYITHLPTPNLNGKHTVFGRVVDGLDLARSIEIDDEIIDVVVIRKRDHEYEPETIPVGGTPPPARPPLSPTSPTQPFLGSTTQPDDR